MNSWRGGEQRYGGLARIVSGLPALVPKCRKNFQRNAIDSTSAKFRKDGESYGIHAKASYPQTSLDRGRDYVRHRMVRCRLSESERTRLTNRNTSSNGQRTRINRFAIVRLLRGNNSGM